MPSFFDSPSKSSSQSFLMYPEGALDMRKFLAPRIREDVETGGYGPKEMADLRNMYQRALTRQRTQAMRNMRTQMSRAGTYDSGLAYRTGQEMHRQGAQSMERGLNSLLTQKIAARAQAMGRGMAFAQPMGGSVSRATGAETGWGKQIPQIGSEWMKFGGGVATMGMGMGAGGTGGG